jgi:site-specific DNA-methyltransferase (adenine-specific)
MTKTASGLSPLSLKRVDRSPTVPREQSRSPDWHQYADKAAALESAGDDRQWSAAEEYAKAAEFTTQKAIAERVGKSEAHISFMVYLGKSPLFRLEGLPFAQAYAKAKKRIPRDDTARGRALGTEDLEIRHGDFRSVLADIPDDSVPLILTDPPYADENVPLYVDLAAFAAAKLEPGGSLICYTGHTILPLVLPPMSDLLRYWWLLALDHQSGTRQLPGKWVRAGWKPVMWFVKGSRRDHTFVRDVIRGVKPDKSAHGWAQGVDEVLPLIESLSAPGELVVDPFAGSGAFGIAASKVGRRFLGADDADD